MEDVFAFYRQVLPDLKLAGAFFLLLVSTMIGYLVYVIELKIRKRAERAFYMYAVTISDSEVSKELLEIFHQYPRYASEILAVYGELRNIGKTRRVIQMIDKWPHIHFSELVVCINLGILDQDWENWAEDDFISWRNNLLGINQQ